MPDLLPPLHSLSWTQFVPSIDCEKPCLHPPHSDWVWSRFPWQAVSLFQAQPALLLSQQ
jgi:hypothetical protein